MSKDGSITPRTVRGKPEDLPLTPEEVASILEYDGQFLEYYTKRNEGALETPRKRDLGEKALGKLERYCDSGKFKGLKQAFESKFSKIAEVIPKVASSAIEQCQITDSLRFVKIFQHRKDDAVADLGFDPSEPIVRHYGINSINSAIFIGHAIKEDTLHPIERSVFKSAVEYLEEKNSSAQEIKEVVAMSPIPKPNNVVLVSFFPRKFEDKFLGAKIIVADEKYHGEAETHTIALWNDVPKEITIIDPTDRTFSQFLVSILNKTDALKPYIFKMESSEVLGVDRKVITEIYRPKYGLEKSLKFARDCTDIAVKIAFELNEQQADPLVPVGDILANTIKQISNATLPKAIGLFRALQSSDVSARHAAKKFVDKAKSVGAKLKDDDTVLRVLAERAEIEWIREVSDLIGALDELGMDLLI
ncbi:MAG: hypothetical protein J0L79_02665 [Rickettsiales bacterium]|nr:hypothetical protein [Rickettsiales bacterium]MCA0254393.1 hypothetical protein [Pseudomonadota bacterium]